MIDLAIYTTAELKRKVRSQEEKAKGLSAYRPSSTVTSKIMTSDQLMEVVAEQKKTLEGYQKKREEQKQVQRQKTEKKENTPQSRKDLLFSYRKENQPQKQPVTKTSDRNLFALKEPVEQTTTPPRLQAAQKKALDVEQMPKKLAVSLPSIQKKDPLVRAAEFVVDAGKYIGKRTAASVPLLAETAKQSLEDGLQRATDEEYGALSTRINILKSEIGMMERFQYETPEEARRDPEWIAKKKALAEAEEEMARKFTPEAVLLDGWGGRMYESAMEDRQKALEGMTGLPKTAASFAIDLADAASTLPLNAVVPGASLALMGVKSGAQKTYELAKEGETPGRALTRGAVSGGIELATEKIPLDNLLKIWNSSGRQGTKAALKSMLTQAGIEGTEETVSYLANTVADIASGDEDAQLRWEDALLSAGSGALGGGIFGGGAWIGQRVRPKNRNHLTEAQVAQESRSAKQQKDGLFRSGALQKQAQRQAFWKKVDGVFDGSTPEQGVLLVEDTPEILQRYGAKNLQMTITPSAVRKIAYPQGYMGGKHNLGVEAVKRLPEQLEDPVAILKSKTQPSSLVVLTQWEDMEGNPVIAAVHLDKRGVLTPENRIASAYGKKDFEVLLGKEGENVLYTKENRSIHQLLSGRLRLPTATADGTPVTFIIPQEAQKSKQGTVENSGGQAETVTQEKPVRRGQTAKSESYRARQVNQAWKEMKNSWNGVVIPKETEAALKAEMQAASDEILRGNFNADHFDRMIALLSEQAMVDSDALFLREDGADVRQALKTRMYVAPEVKAALPDAHGFEQQNFGRLQLTSDAKAISVDRQYQQLQELYPYLFPEMDTEIDQLLKMGEVAEQVSKKQIPVKEVWDKREDVSGPMIQSVIDFFGGLEKSMAPVKRFEVEQAAKDKREIPTDEGGKPLLEPAYRKNLEQLRNDRKRSEYLRSKQLLTESDQKLLDLVASGEMTMDQLPKTSNQEAIGALAEQRKRVLDGERAMAAYKRYAKEKYRSLAEAVTVSSDMWKDKSNGRRYSREIPERNLEDITKKVSSEFGDVGKQLVDTYITPIKKNEAEKIRVLRNLQGIIQALDLSTKEWKLPKGKEIYIEGRENIQKVSESALVQLYGEGKVSKDFLKEIGADVEKIEKADKVFQEIYDQLLISANEVLLENGYEPVPRRKTYYPHWTEKKAETPLAWLGEKALGIRVEENSLPTSIAGITDTFRPGKQWVGNFLARETDITDYGALEGFDRYVGNVLNEIYHTEDIQKLRGLEQVLREKYSEEGMKERAKEIRENTDLSEEEKQVELDRIYGDPDNKTSHLPNFVTWLHEYTNLLAGKKSQGDRMAEQEWGRQVYDASNGLAGRVGANMVGMNVGSWLTNAVPVTQVLSVASPADVSRAALDTMFGAVSKQGDAFWDASSFLTRRRGVKPLVRTTGQKVTEKLTAGMEVLDQFASEIVTRSIYHRALREGMDSKAAMEKADDLAARLMADRSYGATPTLFQRKNFMTKLFTMFQLEVNNQFRFMLKDLPKEYQGQAVKGLTGAFLKMFLAAYLWNNLEEKVIGQRSAFDPIWMVQQGIAIAMEEDKDWYTKGTEIGKMVAEEIPFVGSLLGGGRIPIQSALPDMGVVQDLLGDGSGEYKKQQLMKAVAAPLAYTLFPVGGGQVKKTIEGIGTVSRGGAYTYDKEGNLQLQFPLENPTAKDYAQAALFGRWALQEGQAYVEDGFPKLSAKDTAYYEAGYEMGIDYETFMAAKEAAQRAQSDKDSEGKTIALSKSKNQKAAIDQMFGDTLNRKQLELLYEANGISPQVW